MSHSHEKKALKNWIINTVIVALTIFFLEIISMGLVRKYFDAGSSSSVYMSISVTAYLSSMLIMFYLCRNYVYQAFKTPRHHLMMIIKSKDNAKEIECPQAFGELSGVVKEINGMTHRIYKESSFDQEVVNNIQSAIAITDMSSEILFTTNKFNQLFSTSCPVGMNLCKVISEKTEGANKLKDNKLIHISNADGSVSLYQMLVRLVNPNSSNHKIYEFQNVDEVVELKKKLSIRYAIDELTSLNTRFHFNDIADEVISNSLPSESHYLVLIDINDFKILNDSAGHDIGDVILMELASIVRTHSDEGDVTGRMSGDEFVILYKNKTQKEIEIKLSSLYKAIKEYKIEHFDTKIGVSVSIGVTKACNSKDFTGVRTLLQQADLAVMAAKKNGFMFKFYDHTDSDIMFYREAPIWINRIKNSISHNSFELFVQEIKPFDQDKDLHLEVLLRMKNDQGGYYPPNDFLNVAEKFNLTKQIDEWVVINAFKGVVNGLFNDCKVSINLSADTIKDINAVEKIIHYAKFFKVNASKIVFEITETMAIDDLNAAISNINSMKIAGFSIALDDFGSGFSTFKYIQNIPADYLKIDGIFVKNATKNDRDRAIVANIVNIAHELDMHCVAEFVEDNETVTLMNELGVDYIQGFFVHKPFPASQWKAYQESKLKNIA